MSDDLTISVDGEDGAVVSRNAGIRFVGEDALVRYDGNRDGKHGQNAAPATCGGPAGFMAFELWESGTVPEGIYARLLRHASRQQPPSSVEVPAMRDVIFTAIGGTGEAGNTGFDGQPGMDGVDGSPASREVDATPGTNGGNGGDAGHGTHGANGGDGGVIEIHVDEENTHLLLAVKWDVRGGLGGAPGRHGNPGAGGRGGHGGLGHVWNELVGYRYECTNRCLGLVQGSTSSSLVRVGSRIGSGTTALAANLSRQIVQGPNLQAVIAQAAIRWGALRQQRQQLNTARCKCAGAPADVSCVGCNPVAIHTRFERTAALDGRDGRPGASRTTPLFAGAAGQEGTATIVVRMRDGKQQEYASKYSLELIDFDIEDENGDGIFEPGEYIYVRRIRVRNNGGMPSPTCRIPITVRRSLWLEPTESQALIPSSIGAGESVTLDDPIKVLIRASDVPPSLGSLFIEQDTLSLAAQMSWLNRELPHFEYRRTLSIQYPVELRGFNFLKTMAQGSTSRFAFELYNKGLRTLGSASPSMRTVEVCSSFPADCGTLLCPMDKWANAVTHDVANAASTTATALSQTIRIDCNADDHRHVDIWMGVYLDDPIHGDAQYGEVEVGRNLIQQVNLRIQISSHYNYNPQSSFLLVTSSEITRSRVQAIQNFINDNLEKQLDIWNICLYGGFKQMVDEGEDLSTNVISRYHGKSVIFLGDPFEFFGAGQRVIAELCDPRILAKASARNTSYLFLGSSGGPAFQKLLERVVFPMPYSMANLSRSIPDSNKFDSREDLIESVKQNKFLSDREMHVYTVPMGKRWYRLGKVSPNSGAAKLARYLRQQLPQERFLVAPVEEEISSSGASPGNDPQDDISQERHNRPRLAILHGCPHKISAIATEPRIATSHHLDSFERFMLVRVLPVSKRIDILWTSPGPAYAEAFQYTYFSLLNDINLEIQAFLHKSRWPDKLKSPKDAPSMKSFLRLHLPIFFKLLQHPSSLNQSTPPEHVLYLLQYAEASCLPQKKRHILRTTIVPFLQRRTHLRHILHSTISTFLAHKSYDKKAISTFHATAKALHSNFDRNKRHTGKVILSQVSEVTRRSLHQYEKGHRTASTVVPRSMYCSEQQWRHRWQGVEDARARVREETKRAREQLGHMILDEEEGQQVELPGQQVEPPGQEVETPEQEVETPEQEVECWVKLGRLSSIREPWEV